MTDGVFQHDDLGIDDEGNVTGSARTVMRDGVDVHASVSSYDYERDGERRMNHVPVVRVVKEDGVIVAEPHARDSENPQSAIDNAKSTAEYVFKHLGEFTG